MKRALAFMLCTGGLPLAATAQTDFIASQPPQVAAVEVRTDDSGAPEAAESTERIAERPTLRVPGTYSLSDGPLTVDILDGLSRPLLRVSSPATAEDLRLPAPALPAGTYTVRVLDARGRELHRQRVVYRPR